MSEQTLKSTSALAGAIVISAILLFVGINMALGRADTYLKLKAIGDCGNLSRYTKTDEKTGVSVSYPMVDIYKSCLKEKGYDK